MVSFPRLATNSPSSQGNTMRSFTATFHWYSSCRSYLPAHTAPGAMGKRRLEKPSIEGAIRPVHIQDQNRPFSSTKAYLCPCKPIVSDNKAPLALPLLVVTIIATPSSISN